VYLFRLCYAEFIMVYNFTLRSFLEYNHGFRVSPFLNVDYLKV
jgi:hypothetical protein